MNPTKSCIFVPHNLIKLIVCQSNKEWVLKKCDENYVVNVILIIINVNLVVRVQIISSYSLE